MKTILHNRIRCLKCGEVIESTSEHDFKMCSCGLCAVDGGKEYIRRCGKREDWEEMSEFENHPPRTVIYARVSSAGDRQDTERQVEGAL